ncbi:neutral/alkaline non-lysosomal ceramidase N-terminal domain-containing protein [Aeromicrobium stalagmiti]|uniref:neutral/alkaline non-lysosomal ceramidase N-terminal domain-containing protein n=1 Tax=Aeromicrobium stalagmiti TaxID=2738988 RepID=UPI001569D49E|nr:neutral/alkaline non-lysosomal ceramidase N-terminal domain-containing protein [Aeromicrobium stalagmiti]NRQ50310.1 neutral/alkaline non-lysosomal ceramidase N-terminal domain-containing protein [Aeromicrobium stalagmiti]
MVTEDGQLLVGRGIADITGEPWGAGMMGYGMPDQRTCGILTRQYARAFVMDDGERRIVYVVADIAMFFQATTAGVLARLRALHGDRFGAHNVVLTATHTHCGPGGHGHHVLYNITTAGFHRRTYDRIVGGVVEAITRAVDDLHPSTLVLNRGELHDASANRSRAAFDRDPDDERAHFPGAVDPMTTLLRIERDGALAGAISWFAVHNTSMTNRNRLISSDNKGWAAYAWESAGRAPRTAAAELVTAFAQTNAGDISPNLDLRPGTGPTDDERENTRIIGERQLAAAQSLAGQPGERLEALVDSRLVHVDMARQVTPRGATSPGVLGASFAAGKLTDGPGSPLFDEGRNNPVFERLSRPLYRRSPALAASQAPKDMAIPVGMLRWSQERFPVQLVRIGGLYLVCLPFEVTIVSGLRIRRRVAEIVGADLDHVLCQGYANGFGHYVTTPEEYDVQNYEGGSTIFGRHELDALIGAAAGLAEAMAAGRPVDPGPPPAPHRVRIPTPLGHPALERQRTIDVLDAPSQSTVGDTVSASFVADHPNAEIRPTYLLVERQAPTGWEVVADDSSLTTTITWRRDRRLHWTAEVTWTADDAGTYRITYVGRTTATTPPFPVVPAPATPHPGRGGSSTV